MDSQGKVVRYNLAYINHDVFQGDNGRVVGYEPPVPALFAAASTLMLPL